MLSRVVRTSGLRKDGLEDINVARLSKGLEGWLVVIVAVVSVRYLPCSVLTLDRRSTWPAEYCSITSFTSYGFSASLNLRRAVKYLIYAQEGRQLVCWTKSGLMGTVCRP